MRMFRQLTMVGFVMFLALAYVHQHVELVKLSYAIQYNEKRVAKLLDRNERLGYNVDNLENPSRLEAILQAQKIDVAMPKRAQIVTVSQPSSGQRVPESEAMGVESSSPFRVFEFLTLRAEAQAKER